MFKTYGHPKKNNKREKNEDFNEVGLHAFRTLNKTFWLKTNVPNFCLYATALTEQWCCCFQKFFSNFLT